MEQGLGFQTAPACLPRWPRLISSIYKVYLSIEILGPSARPGHGVDMRNLQNRIHQAYYPLPVVKKVVSEKGVSDDGL